VQRLAPSRLPGVVEVLLGLLGMRFLESIEAAVEESVSVDEVRSASSRSRCRVRTES